MRSLTSAVVLLASGAAAFAQDGGVLTNDPHATPLRGPLRADAPPPALALAAVPGWGGLHLGADIGIGGDRDVFAATPASLDARGSASLATKTSGFIGGGHAGFDYAFAGGPLLGVEADFSGSTIGSAADLTFDGTSIASAGSRISFLGTVRGRIGYGFGPLLGYVTGGFAYADVKSGVSLAGFGSRSVDTSHEGYVVGGGFEYALASNVSLRTEYLRVVLNARPLLTTSYYGGLYTLGERPTANIVRAGIDFRFAQSGLLAAAAPVIARY